MNSKKTKSKKSATGPDETITPEIQEAAPSQITAEATQALEAQPTPAKTSGKENSKTKKTKTKVIRDSFSFPEHDYLKISLLKKTCLAQGTHVKKSEILRAGLQLLSKLNSQELTQVLEKVEKLKTGRPEAKH